MTKPSLAPSLAALLAILVAALSNAAVAEKLFPQREYLPS